MPLSFDQVYKEAVASARQDVTFVDTIVLKYYTSASPTFKRYARSDTDLEIGGVYYQGKQFSYTLPELKANTNASLNITIADVAQELAPFIDAILAYKDPTLGYIPMTVLFESYIAGTANKANFIQPMEVQSFSLNNTDLVMQAGYPDAGNRKCPNGNYTTTEFPGLRS